MVIKCICTLIFIFLCTDTKNPLTLEAHKIKLEFFTPETLREVICRLICQYFLLASDDLQNWDADPEDYCKFSSC